MFDSWPSSGYIQCMSDRSDTSSAGAGGRLQSVDPSLTERQRTILNVIRASVTSRGYPPSIREIGDAVGLTSTSSVALQLRTLERKGFIRRDPNRPRAVDVRGADDTARPALNGPPRPIPLPKLPGMKSGPPSTRKYSGCRTGTAPR